MNSRSNFEGLVFTRIYHKNAITHTESKGFSFTYRLSHQLFQYDPIWAKIHVDPDRYIYIYHINNSYLASYTKVEYHKKWQTSALIREIPGTNLETGRYGPKSGVFDDYTAQYWSFNLDYKICQSVGPFKNYTIPLRTEKICLFMRLVTSYVIRY